MYRAAELPLRQCRPGLIYKLGPNSATALYEHFLRLSAEDRYRRFCGTVGEVHLQRYCYAPSAHKRVALGFWSDDILRGVGELIIGATAYWSDGAEVALSIEPDYQNLGVGSELLRRVLVLAANRGESVVRILTQRDNRRVRALANKFAARYENHAGETRIVLDKPRVSHFTLLEEFWNDGYALWQSLLSRPALTA